MADEAVWKRRFHLFLVTRLFGLFVFFGGVAVFFTDLLREGGWPAVGLVLIIVGLAEAVAVPWLLKSQWAKEDQAE